MPPRPENCAIEMKNMDVREAASTHEWVGIVAVQGRGETVPQTAAIRAEVLKRACRLGGKVVILNGSVVNQGNWVSSYNVAIERKAAASAPVKKEAPQKHAPRIVAVFDIQDLSKQLSKKDVRQLSDYLATMLAQQQGFSVVPRDQLRERLATERKKSFKDCYDSTCQIEIGKALAARLALATKLMRVKDTCVLASNLFDIKSEATAGAASVNVQCDQKSILQGITGLVSQLAPR